MNSNIVAILIALALAIVLIPWNMTLAKMQNDSFMIVVGCSFILVGFTSKLFRQQMYLESDGVGLGILTGVVYGLTIMGINHAFHQSPDKIAIISAIIATYPIMYAIIDAIKSKRMPSMIEMIFMVMAIGGVAGLSLFGKK